MHRRQFLAHSLAALSAGGATLASPRSARKRSECNYRIVYNDDGHTMQHVSGLEDFLEKAVDRFRGTQVDALFWSVAHSDIYFFKTRVGEMYGQHVKRFKTATGLQLHEGLHRVLGDREDYLQAMADRARKIGIQFFVTMRMNDCHDSPEGWNFSDQYSQFKRAHPELLLGEAVHPAFATGYDFAHPVPRQRKLAVIEEIVLDHDVDGIELDFMRHPAFFKPDEAYRNRHLITDMVRRVRTLVDRVGKERGTPIRLAARVPTPFANALKLGIDAPAWLEEDLLDVVTAGTPRGHELGLSMSEYVEATRGRAITLLGQIGLYHPVEETRATALNYWKQGVDGIYLFNWYAPLARDDLWRKSLVEIGDPRMSSHRTKRYVIDRQIGAMWTRSHPRAQLPLRIQEAKTGGTARVSFSIGDDVEAAAVSGKSAIAKLIMRLEEVMDDDELALELNGSVLPREKAEVKFKPTLFGKEYWLHLPFNARLLAPGRNELEFILRKRNPRLEAPVILEEMSLMIEYQ